MGTFIVRILVHIMRQDTRQKMPCKHSRNVLHAHWRFIKTGARDKLSNCIHQQSIRFKI